MSNSTAQRAHIASSFTEEMLYLENRLFADTGGVSHNNREKGFVSAFRDSVTGRVYRSRFADGSPASVHVLDGLPEELVVRRSSDGSIAAIKPTIIAGFAYAGRFYTREQAAHCLASY